MSKIKNKSGLAEAQNWRCCFCGTRMIGWMEDEFTFARENGMFFKKYAQNQHIRSRIAQVFRFDWNGNGKKNSCAVGCASCVSGVGSMPIRAYLKVVELQLFAGTHSSLVDFRKPNSITYTPKKPVPVKPKQRQKRPHYAHSEMM
jgi:hypothetical protein